MPWQLVVVIAALIVGGWRIDVWLYPFAPCRRCKGSGMSRGSKRTAYGLCKHGPRRVRFTGRRSADRQMARIRRP